MADPDDIGLLYAGLWTDSITYDTGHVAANVTVEVRVKGATTLATLYGDRTKASTVANPTKTDSQGNLSVYAEPGVFTASVPAVGGKFDFLVPPDPLDIRTSGTDNLVASVNGQIGDVVLTGADVGAVVEVNGQTGSSITLDAGDVGAVADADVVHITGSETIGGTKTFSASPVVPTPASAAHAVRKDYVDGGFVPTGRTVSTGSGLTGGGDLSANRTLAPDWGSGANNVPRGTHQHLAPVVTTLVDASTVTIDGSLGSHFRLTATSGVGNTRTLGPPTNLSDGQRYLVEYVQDGTGSRALVLSSATGGFVASPEVVSYTATTTASKRDFLGFIYSAALNKSILLAVSKGN